MKSNLRNKIRREKIYSRARPQNLEVRMMISHYNQIDQICKIQIFNNKKVLEMRIVPNVKYVQDQRKIIEYHYHGSWRIAWSMYILSTKKRVHHKRMPKERCFVFKIFPKYSIERVRIKVKTIFLKVSRVKYLPLIRISM